MKTFIRHKGRKHRKIQYKNRLQYDETIQYNILQYSIEYEKKYKYIYFVIGNRPERLHSFPHPSPPLP